MLATLLAAAEAGGEAKEVINPVLPDWPEVFWGAIFFFGFWALMKFVLLPPIKKAMRQRDETIQGDLEAAEKAKAEAEAVRRDYDATLHEARAQAAALIDEARREADAKRGVIMAKVESEIAEQRQAAMVEIEASRRAAIDQLRPAVGQLAISAASKVVQRQVDPASAQATIDAHVNAAGGIGGES